MNVLVFAYYSAWSWSVGSRRISGIIDGLGSRGHSVTVVTSNPTLRRTRVINGAITVVETPPTDRVLAIRRHRSSSASATALISSASVVGDVGCRAQLNDLVRPWISFPDTMWEWTYRAQRASRGLEVTPDCILATGPPVAALHAGAAVARRLGVPWVADLRDLWSGDPNRQIARPLRQLDRRLERRTLGSADAIITVADDLSAKISDAHHSISVHTRRNGFPPSWLRHGDAPPAQPPRIVFSGSLHTSTGRSVAPIANLAESLAGDGPDQPTIDVYGTVPAAARRALNPAVECGTIRLLGVVDANTVKRAQHEAAVLLSIGWNDDRESSNLPAKLFEYAASRRPIVHIGTKPSLGTELIESNRLGMVTWQMGADEIAALVNSLCYRPGELWSPPSIDQLEPLSQSTMVDEVIKILASTTMGPSH